MTTALTRSRMINAMRVAIVGCRDWRDTSVIRDLIERLPADTVVVSGHGGNVDLYAERAAKARGLQTLIFPADWKKYGRSAGPLRNATIVGNSDYVIAPWDGKSHGTHDTIRKAESAGIPVQIVYPGHWAEVPKE